MGHNRANDDVKRKAKRRKKNADTKAAAQAKKAAAPKS